MRGIALVYMYSMHTVAESWKRIYNPPFSAAAMLLIQCGRTTRTSPAFFFISDRCKTARRFILSRRRE